MNKVIVFDVDGVIVRSKDSNGHFLWQANIKNDLGIDSEVMRDIFGDPRGWLDCTLGKTDTKTYFQSRLAKYAVNIGADVLIEYWLTRDTHFDSDVMACIESLQGQRVFIASNQDRLRADHLVKTIGHLFEDVFVSSDIGAAKPEEKFFQYVEEALRVQPASIIFFDDQAENVATARRRGWDAHVFKDASDLKKVIG
jgi:HAD superfamily hydrolase (TIGR01509 family)